jgi:hypothetical protein
MELNLAKLNFRGLVTLCHQAQACALLLLTS